MSKPVSIRKVNPEEFKILTEFGRKTFYETWRDVNTEEDMRLYLDYAFDESKILMELNQPETFTFYFTQEQELISGYSKLRNDRSPDEFKGHAALEIERIYVLKEFHGKIAGKVLMDQCISQAKSEGYKWLWLGVNIDNHRAIAFYKKYGFTVFGSKMFKLGNAEDKDYLMKRAIEID